MQAEEAAIAEPAEGAPQAAEAAAAGSDQLPAPLQAGHIPFTRPCSLWKPGTSRIWRCHIGRCPQGARTCSPHCSRFGGLCRTGFG